jgi:hypothetical protein
LANASSSTRIRERLEKTALLGHGAVVLAACRSLGFQAQASFLQRGCGARLDLLL